MTAYKTCIPQHCSVCIDFGFEIKMSIDLVIQAISSFTFIRFVLHDDDEDG